MPEPSRAWYIGYYHDPACAELDVIMNKYQDGSLEVVFGGYATEPDGRKVMFFVLFFAAGCTETAVKTFFPRAAGLVQPCEHAVAKARLYTLQRVETVVLNLDSGVLGKCAGSFAQPECDSDATLEYYLHKGEEDAEPRPQ